MNDGSNRTGAAVSHPNIALAKYWGKARRGNRLPAVPSLSVTLAGLATTTVVELDGSLPADELWLDGRPAEGRAVERVSRALDELRQKAGSTARARVISRNDFPTAAGLASSASAFAALAVAGAAALGLELETSVLSDFARRCSVSAARSLYGGFVELPLYEGKDPEKAFLSAEPVAPPASLPLRVLVAVTARGPKAVSSTEGMLLTQETSPYFGAWAEDAPKLFERIKRAVKAGDFDEVGRAAEASALRMHAAALAAEPAICYWNPRTLAALSRVKELRASGCSAYATIDAGPHVKVLAQPANAAAVREALLELEGIDDVLVAEPGPGAYAVPADATELAAPQVGDTI